MATLCIIVALSFAILIHELGHMIVLKRNGFKVDKFCLGIPIGSLPYLRIWKDKGGTEYCICLLMFGGAVCINKKEEVRIEESSLWLKTKFYMSGMFMNTSLAFVIFSTIFLYYSRLHNILSGLAYAFYNSFVMWFCAIPLSVKVISSGKVPISDAVVGPIGVVQVMNNAYSAGMIDFLLWVAMLNVGLAAFNLLPIWPLDGGHMFIAIVKRFFPKFNKKFIGLFQRVSLIFFILFVIMILTKDIWIVFFGSGYSFPIR